jgi:UDP-N-acetylmuramyl pentapeptide phosphotransferase/UDP-N-acetylglucosamine-1-phosphate transferase
MPLYYVADATLTLARRLARGERVWEAHRTHFYQRATDNGYTVPMVVARVFITNICLLAIAVVSVRWSGAVAVVTCGALAIGAVTAVLRQFSRPR